MAEEPDRIRDDIEATRSDLARNVDLLADRTVPTRVARRRWGAMKVRMRGVSDRVMGSSSNVSSSVADKASDVSSTVADKASDVAGSVRQAPRVVARQTQGNPIAVGVIAFGAGLLTASLIPATDLERRAGQQVKENAGDLVDKVREPLTESAQQVREEVTGSAREAAQQVKETAQDAAQTTKEEAKLPAQDAADQTRAAAAGE